MKKLFQSKNIEMIKISSNITLFDVLYIISFAVNLISVNKLSNDLNLRISFDKNSCIFQESSKLNGAYTLEDITDMQLLIQKVQHSRFGHPSLKRLKYVIVSANIKFIENCNKSDHCNKQFANKDSFEYNSCVYPKAKQQKLKFPRSKFQSDHLFESIHTHIWRKFSI